MGWTPTNRTCLPWESAAAMPPAATARQAIRVNRFMPDIVGHPGASVAENLPKTDRPHGGRKCAEVRSSGLADARGHRKRANDLVLLGGQGALQRHRRLRVAVDR